MIIIQTYKMDRKTLQPHYKDYHATCGLKAEMSLIQQDRDNNDMTIYEPIVIYNVWDNQE